jgi:hypothetical protein
MSFIKSACLLPHADVTKCQLATSAGAEWVLSSQGQQAIGPIQTVLQGDGGVH